MATLRSLRVLVVEDEAILALDLSDILEDLGHEVIGPAPSVARALSLLEGLATPPDAAIIDMNLGGEMSTEVVERLEGTHTRVIVASGYGSHELDRLGVSCPVVRKPYNRKRIAAALEDGA
jgi:CheY-like chemotaxis protein